MKLIPSLAFLAALSLALLTTGALASPPPRVAGEVEQLMGALGRSGCQFQRNGTWYPAAKAEAHLRRKYEWLSERDLIGSTEDFIERAGSQSSLTGRAYQVSCPGAPVTTSAQWLRARLDQIRHPVPASH